jgi:hypothetical protein
VAVLEKGGPGAETEEAEGGPSDPLAAFDTVDPEPWLAPVIERFGLPEEPFRRTLLVRGGRGVLSLVPDDLRPPAQPEVSAVGLSFLHTAMRNPKLTTAAAMAIGARATRNAVELDRPALGRYLEREDQELSAESLTEVSAPGYALARHAVAGSTGRPQRSLTGASQVSGSTVSKAASGSLEPSSAPSLAAPGPRFSSTATKKPPVSLSWGHARRVRASSGA